jgi:hypothetical protein
MPHWTGGAMEIRHHTVASAQHPCIAVWATPDAIKRQHPRSGIARLEELHLSGGHSAVEFMDRPHIMVRLRAHWRQRCSLIPIRSVEAQHRLLRIPDEPCLAKDLAQFIVALRQRCIDPLDTHCADFDTQ